MAERKEQNPLTASDVLSKLHRYIDELGEVAGAARKGTAAELAYHFVEVRAFYDLLELANTKITLLKTKMATEDIPKAFEAEGTTTLTLKSGYRVTTSKRVLASTRDMEQGIGWMRLCKCGHTAEKHETGQCTETYPVVDQERTTKKRKASKLVQCACIEYDAPNASLVKETINASTLSAFAKSELEEGRELPETIFNVFIGDNTSVTKVK